MAGNLTDNSAPFRTPYNAARSLTKYFVYEGTLSGTTALDETYPNRLKLDPGGASRDVTLDAVATSDGLWYHIVNAADAAENLVLKNAGGSTIATINQNEEAIVYCDGTSWRLFRVATIALS